MKLGTVDLRVTRIVHCTAGVYAMLNAEDAALGLYRHPLHRS
jgi:hypothetical protein